LIKSELLWKNFFAGGGEGVVLKPWKCLHLVFQHFKQTVISILIMHISFREQTKIKI
jgi:hypothetical protein